MENNKGTLKYEIDTIEVHDFNLKIAIVDSLLEKGFHIIEKPILENGQHIGVSLTIYSVERR